MTTKNIKDINNTKSNVYVVKDKREVKDSEGNIIFRKERFIPTIYDEGAYIKKALLILILEKIYLEKMKMEIEFYIQ